MGASPRGVVLVVAASGDNMCNCEVRSGTILQSVRIVYTSTNGHAGIVQKEAVASSQNTADAWSKLGLSSTVQASMHIGHNLPVSMPHVDPAALLTQRVVLCRALEG